jgi:methionine synthase I (cobalamin-dependent)
MGTYLEYEWDWSSCPTPDEIVEYARAWADEGMQIIGGCCGARPSHIRGLVEAFKVPAGV